MKPGARWRNFAVGIGYGFLILMIIGAVAPEDTDSTEQGPTTTIAPTESQTDAAARTTTDEDEPVTTTAITKSTSTATVNPTPTPTETSTPTATQTPTPTPAPDDDSYSYSDSGQTASESFSLSDGLATFDLSHTGDSNFIVKLVNANTGEEEHLVNVIGSFDGTVATYTPSGNYVLDIDANGQWNAGIAQPRYSRMEVESLPASLDGQDFGVLGPNQFEGATRLSYDAETDSNVIIYLLNHEGETVDVLVNEIGPSDGSTAFSADGVGLIYVETEGEWSIQIESA